MSIGIAEFSVKDNFHRAGDQLMYTGKQTDEKRNIRKTLHSRIKYVILLSV